MKKFVSIILILTLSVVTFLYAFQNYTIEITIGKKDNIATTASISKGQFGLRGAEWNQSIDQVKKNVGNPQVSSISDKHQVTITYYDTLYDQETYVDYIFSVDDRLLSVVYTIEYGGKIPAKLGLDFYQTIKNDVSKSSPWRDQSVSWKSGYQDKYSLEDGLDNGYITSINDYYNAIDHSNNIYSLVRSKMERNPGKGYIFTVTYILDDRSWFR